MRLILVLVLALTAMTSLAYGQSVTMAGPNRAELTEGKKYVFNWQAGGAETVSIAIYGTRTPLGATPRGNFHVTVMDRAPAAQGEFKYTLPWIDAVKFTVKMKSYDGSGHVVGSSEREYGFRPSVLANRLKDGIYLDLHERVNQRLYVQKSRRIVRVYLCSSSQRYFWLPSNRHIAGPHDHAGVFRVQEKSPSHWSTLYDVQMRWSMRYLGGHFIHATSSNLYRLLGHPASHGCDRLTRYDAYQLYLSTPVGTRVEVIGPRG